MSKIIFFSTLTLWSMGKGKGGPAFTKTVLNYIDKGWDTYLITDEPSNADCDFLDDAHKFVFKPSFFKPLTHVRYMSPFFKRLDCMLMRRNFCKKAEEILGSNPSDCILYAYEVHGVGPAKELHQKYKLPMVTRFQGTILTKKENTFLNRLRLYPYFYGLSQKSDLIIMTNDGTQGDRVLKRLKNNSKVLFVMNGLDLLDLNISDIKQNFDRNTFRMSISKKIRDNTCMFLTVSRLENWKRVDRAIDGFADFCKRNDNGILVIVGDGDERTALEERVKKYNIENKVVFTGSVAHGDVYNYMMACDVFLSLYDLSNVGNPLLEAMALGKCVITYDIGDTKEFIKNRKNGILLTDKELPELGKYMEEVAADHNKREQYGQAASKFAKEHFWNWKERLDYETEEVKKLLNNN